MPRTSIPLEDTTTSDAAGLDDAAVPGALDDDASEREHVLVAIREAFDAASRQIEDIARDMRGQVKEHTAESHGRVAKLLVADECGFIETADGREIYVHRNAVLDGAYR